MLMVFQFQGFKQGEELGFSAQETGGTLFRSRLNKDRSVSLDYRQRGTSSDLNQVYISTSRPFDPYPQELSGSRSQGEVESKINTRICGWGSDGFVRRLQRHSLQKWCRDRIYAPRTISPIAISFFRELYRAGYDLIKTIILKLKYYKTRQDAVFKENTFKEDQKCH
jgi:hypothetical protein